MVIVFERERERAERAETVIYTSGRDRHDCFKKKQTKINTLLSGCRADRIDSGVVKNEKNPTSTKFM